MVNLISCALTNNLRLLENGMWNIELNSKILVSDDDGEKYVEYEFGVEMSKSHRFFDLKQNCYV